MVAITTETTETTSVTEMIHHHQVAVAVAVVAAARHQNHHPPIVVIHIMIEVRGGREVRVRGKVIRVGVGGGGVNNLPLILMTLYPGGGEGVDDLLLMALYPGIYVRNLQSLRPCKTISAV